MSLIVGPQKCVTKVSPYQITGKGIRGILPISQLPGLIVGTSLSDKGIIRTTIWNATQEARCLSARTCLVAVLRLPGAKFVMTASDICGAHATEEGKRIDAWMKLYPAVFSTPRFDEERALRLEIRASEIEWTVPIDRIPLMNRGVSYGVGEIRQEDAKAELNRLEDQGVIRRLRATERAFYSPILWVRKKDGSPRCTIDLRLLNAYVKPWRSATPGVMATLQSIPADWSHFSVLDLRSGFYHFSVDRTLQTLFAFEQFGIRYTYVCLPMGWSPSPGLFASRVRSVLSGLSVIQYADDLLIGGPSATEHDANLDAVFQRLSDFGFHANREKVQLCSRRVQFLGYDVEPKGYSLGSFLQSKMDYLPSANTVTQLKKLLGLLNVIRGSCPGLAHIIEPLQSELREPPENRKSLMDLQQMTKGIWSKILDCHQRLSFLPKDTTRWYIRVDWSTSSRGYALWSGHPNNGVLVMIGSSRISDHPSSMVGELQALIWSLRQCWDIVIGSEVVVQTDSQSAWMRLKKTPSAEALKDVRILRAFEWLTANWGSRLTIEFLPGEENVLADLLSRWHEPPSKEMTVFLEDDGPAEVLRLDHLTTQRRTAIEKAHYGHWGVFKTLSHLRRDGWHWINDAKDVAEFVRVCPICQRFRMQASPDRWSGMDCQEVNEIVHLDFLGPVHWQRRSRWVLVMIDGLSRYIQLRSATKPNSKVVIQALNSWIRNNTTDESPLRSIFTDNAQVFCGLAVSTWCEEQNVSHLTSGVYSPQSNGLVERSIQTIKERMRRFKLQRKELSLNQLEDVLNDAVHKVTQFTPNELMHGRQRDGQITLMQEVIIWRQRAHQRTLAAQKHTEQCLRRGLGRQGARALQLGQKVLVFEPERRRSPLAPAWNGPYVLEKKIGRKLWKIRRSGQLRGPYHSSRLRVYFDDEEVAQGRVMDRSEDCQQKLKN